ncbi:hypothetical protein AB0M94_38025 [Streptomyces xanthochromogenes]|uniref:hypothetical protein n=1 Tax=Streptomyces xanthochromogenes TaxID=67384 RepID=UPI0034334304
MARPEQQDLARNPDGPRSDTVLDEALNEFEEAELRHVDKQESDADARRDGEARDALTPNEEAQVEAVGD